jgi:hypothetical protein
MAKRLVVFVHGWSTTHTSTYGGLPKRLIAEAAAAGIDITEHQIFLSKYVSFRDEVRVEDVAKALEAAVRTEMGPLIAEHGRFTAITHSTGGPVVREWHKRHYVDKPRSGPCPMSHLVMLAPANFGSALAVLGKSRVGRIKAWKDGVEPGTGVLDWLQLGSEESWDLNEWWIRHGDEHIGGTQGIFPFVLTGQTIDRKLYDHVNSYTGESGSDGVVRVAAANLNAIHVRLEQERPATTEDGRVVAPKLSVKRPSIAPRTAMRVVAQASHSGTTHGIMGSVGPEIGGRNGAETVGAIIDALRVRNTVQYDALAAAWLEETHDVQERERVETEKRRPFPDRKFIHDRCSMVIARITDTAGYRIGDFDLLLTGDKNDPDLLPTGFLSDRQFNNNSSALTLFLNHDLMVGSERVPTEGRTIRPKLKGVGRLGLIVVPRPSDGFVHYLPCNRQALPGAVAQFVKPNQTTLVDIVLQRVVHGGVFELDHGTSQRSFKRVKPGGIIP